MTLILSDTTMLASSALTVTVTVNENQTFALTAQEDGGTITYHLSGDAALFNIDETNDDVTFNTVPDFENPTDAEADNDYDLIIAASDGNNSADQTIVTNENDNTPVFNSDITATVSENLTTNTAAYTAVATDDDGDTLSYSISGADSALFSIDSTSGVVTFNNAPDFENPTNTGADNDYDLIVTANDGTNSTDQTVTINVTNVSEAPIFQSGTTATASENQTAAYTVLATDSDGDTVSYVLLAGADSGLFNMALDGTLTFNNAPDFENPADANGDNVYEVNLLALSGGNFARQSLSIEVTNENDIVPVFSSGITATVSENQTAAYTALATDVDGDTLSYSLSGEDASLFSIDSSTGIVSFNAAADFETPADADGDNLYELIVTSNDGVHSISQNLGIEVTNLNEAPVFQSGDTATIAENQTLAYTALANDPDGDSLTYSLTGEDAALFSIDTTSGEVTFNQAPDFENPADVDGDNVYQITTTASDGLNSVDQAISINLTNVAEAPIFQSGTTATAGENQTAAYTALATDSDGDTVSYFLLSSPDSNLFSLAADGTVSFNNAPDFENPADANGDNVYEINLLAFSGSNITSHSVIIEVTNENDNTPLFSSDTMSTVGENETAAYIAVATDGDGDTLSYSLSGADSALFSIDSTSGVVTFNDAPDFENPIDTGANNDYDLIVTASDGVNSIDQAVSIRVTNENDAPVFNSGTVVAVSENQTLAYTALANDPDGDSLTYSLTGEDAALFSIDTISGEVTFNQAPDFENPADVDGDNVYQITTTASDGLNSVDQAISINLTNVSEAPIFQSGTTATAGENQTAAYTALATDSDGDTVSYFLLSSPDSDLFSLAVDGTVSFNNAPDFENPADANGDNVYEINLLAFSGSNITSHSVIIEVTNENDNTPLFSSDTMSTVNENQTVGYTTLATDSDGDTLSYNLSGADSALFSIDSASGVVTFNNAPDFEKPTDTGANNDYDLVVTASDGVNSIDQSIRISVTDILDSIELSEVELDTNLLGFVINGASTNDRSGQSVSNAGDINGDGFDDVIIGAPNADNFTGASYVVFGKTNGTAINLSDLESGSSDGFVIYGAGTDTDDASGWSVSSAGDVNGDGLDDMIIGAIYANRTGYNYGGASYVVFGKADGSAIELSDVELGINGFVINGAPESEENSWSVSNAGDVNGDGLGDLIIGSNYSHDGISYVVFGKTDSTAIELSEVKQGLGGFAINGVGADYYNGRSVVSNAGDINNDGLDDLIIGTPLYDAPNGSNSGASFVVFGKTDGSAIELSNVELGIGGFVINGISAGNMSGYSVSNAGDVNGDGLDDLIIGATFADTNGISNSGASYVVFGKADSETVDIDLANLAAGQGFVINGASTNDRSGRSVSSAGDINADGLDDLIIGAPYADGTGVSYLVYGTKETTTIELSNVANGDGGFVINGIAVNDYSGGSVSSAGDVNGDGFDDLIVGALSADANVSNSGTSYVIFGGQNTEDVILGDDDDNNLNGGTGADQIVAGQGDDTLVGNGGTDVLRGGAGNDILAISDTNFAILDGGNGTDTLRFDAAMTLDFTTLSDNKITSIEQIDLLNDGGDSDIRLNLTDVLNLGGGSTSNPLIDLTIYGDSGDKVILENVSNGQSGSWEDDGTDSTGQFALYNFESGGDVLATVLIDQDINTQTVM